MKILAIWITKGLFIFVICIAEWNVCSNLAHKHFEQLDFQIYDYETKSIELTSNEGLYLFVNKHPSYLGAILITTTYQNAIGKKWVTMCGDTNCTLSNNGTELTIKANAFCVGVIFELIH